MQRGSAVLMGCCAAQRQCSADGLLRCPAAVLRLMRRLRVVPLLAELGDEAIGAATLLHRWSYGCCCGAFYLLVC